MFQKIAKSLPISRLFLYVVILGLIPLVFVSYRHNKMKREWDRVSTEIKKVALLHETKVRRQSLNNLVRKEFGQSDPLYLSRNLEGLALLEKERIALEKLFANRSFTGNESAEKRHAFIVDGENRLSLIEKSCQKSDGIVETAYGLLHPVEIDGENLRQILSVIETKTLGQPQLLCTDFKITRKETSMGSEVYQLSLKLLKREFKQ
ncbi:MAG: hypothetical protein ACKVOH_06165 [Chlamydiales bacterium]